MLGSVSLSRRFWGTFPYKKNINKYFIYIYNEYFLIQEMLGSISLAWRFWWIFPSLGMNQGLLLVSQGEYSSLSGRRLILVFPGAQSLSWQVCTVDFGCIKSSGKDSLKPALSKILPRALHAPGRIWEFLGFILRHLSLPNPSSASPPCRADVSLSFGSFWNIPMGCSSRLG